MDIILLEKTKIFSEGAGRDKLHKFIINTWNVEVCDQYKYLGVNINNSIVGTLNKRLKKGLILSEH